MSKNNTVCPWCGSAHSRTEVIFKSLLMVIGFPFSLIWWLFIGCESNYEFEDEEDE